MSQPTSQSPAASKDSGDAQKRSLSSVFPLPPTPSTNIGQSAHPTPPRSVFGAPPVSSKSPSLFNLGSAPFGTTNQDSNGNLLSDSKNTGGLFGSKTTGAGFASFATGPGSFGRPVSNTTGSAFGSVGGLGSSGATASPGASTLSPSVPALSKQTEINSEANKGNDK